LQIEIHGGAHRIGGNKILIRSKKAAFWLDMGATHKRKLELYQYSQVRYFSLKRLISEGVFPRSAIFDSVQRENEKKYINLILTHAHSDHYSLLTFYKAWQETGISIRLFSPPNLYNLLKTRFEIGNLGRALSNLEPHDIKETEAAGFKVTAVPIDHSIDASYGYVVETSEGTVGYTGDYRFTDQHRFDAMEKPFDDLDTLITEATRVATYNLLTENGVKEQLAWIMRRYGNSTVIVVVGWYTNTTRARSIIEASAGRKVVLHSHVASLLAAADPKILENPKVYVLRMRIREDIPEGAKIMTVPQVNDERGNVVVVIPEAQKLYMWKEETPESILVRPNDVVIGSLSEPYDEDSTEALIDLTDYVTRELKVPIYHTHASGHASLHEIADFVNATSPRRTIVIHSNVPEALRPLVEKKIDIETP